MIYTAETQQKFWEIYQRDLFKFRKASSQTSNVYTEVDDAIHDAALSTFNIWRRRENKAEINIPAYITYCIYSVYKNEHKQRKKMQIHEGYLDYITQKEMDDDECIGKYFCPSNELYNPEIEKKIKLNQFFEDAITILKENGINDIHSSIFKFYYVAKMPQTKVSQLTGYKLRTVKYAVKKCLEILKLKMKYEDYF